MAQPGPVPAFCVSPYLPASRVPSESETRGSPACIQSLPREAVGGVRYRSSAIISISSALVVYSWWGGSTPTETMRTPYDRRPFESLSIFMT